MQLTVSVQTQELQSLIQANRDQHRQIFEEALAGFQTQAIAQLEANIEMLRKGKVPELYLRLPVPEDHTNDYDSVLQMLDMHQEPVLDISQEDFVAYVRDDWSWKRQFISTASNYTANAR